MTFSSSPLPQLLLFPLLLSLPFICSTMENSEKEALLSIMDAMSSDRDWRSYDGKANPCHPSFSWPGLECKLGPDSHYHVTKLVFGTIPNPTCSSFATFPSQIFSLPFLESIHFLNCFKTKRTTLFFPHLHTALQQLSLRANPALVGPIPPQISSLKSLKVLTLSQNRLDGEIPESISALTSLIHLDLSYNSLTGMIPEQIRTLRSLVDLDLSYNSLTGQFPASIGELGMLQKLDLSSNSITGSIPKSVENLKLLSFLALSDNRLSGYPIPHTGLSKLQNLQYLIMDSNPMFVPLPPELGRLPKMQELKLANSGYLGQIPGSFTWLRNLTALSLENNRLTGEIPPGLGGLSRIYHLNLSRNMLGGVVPFSAEFLKRLGRNLDLSGNSGLCLNSGSGQVFGGVRFCGNTPSSSSSSSSSNAQKPLVSSSVNAASLDSQLVYFLLVFMGFSASNHCLRLL